MLSLFRVSGFMLRSLIHFELTLVQNERHGSNFSLHPVFPAAFVEEVVFSTSNNHTILEDKN
jgi:hypothetical protein